MYVYTFIPTVAILTSYLGRLPEAICCCLEICNVYVVLLTCFS